MHRTRELLKLRKAFAKRLARLERRLALAAANTNKPERDFAVAYVTIETLNAWSLFSRSFYLSCAIGALTQRGRRVNITAATTDFIGHAVVQYKRWATPNAAGIWHRRDEPAWHDPNVLMQLCQSLGCSIQTEIEAAFSLRQRVFNDLPVCRNFFAHRNESTSLAARNIAPRYVLPTFLSPSELLLSIGPGTATSMILGWIDELNVTAEFLCDH